MIWITALLAYLSLVMTIVFIAACKYKTFINPITFFSCQFGAQTILAPTLFNYFGLFDWNLFDIADVLKTVGISAIYVACLALAFLSKWSPALPLLRKLTPASMPQIRIVTIVVTFSVTITFFVALMYTSGAGLLWISNSRLAYQTCRVGAGVVWSLCQASLLVCFACVLYRWGKSQGAVVAVCCVFMALAFFLGSKGFVLNYLVLGLFYLDHHVRRVSKRLIAGAAVSLLCGVVVLQILQGTAVALIDTLEYFDYFVNTARFISDFKRSFTYTYGQTLASELWLYVPRALYPGKPFTYGGATIMATYFPGIAEESGSTPGILNWAGIYLDFGVLGVAISGFMTGFVGKAAFELFRTRRTIWNLLLLGQVGLMMGEVTFFRAPYLVFVLWMAAEWMLLKCSSVSVLGRSRPR